MVKLLARFTLSKQDADYILHFEDENGGTFDLRASYDQLDLIADEIDDILDEDEDEALGADGNDKG